MPRHGVRSRPAPIRLCRTEDRREREHTRVLSVNVRQRERHARETRAQLGDADVGVKEHSWHHRIAMLQATSAALINAARIHCLDFDDMHLQAGQKFTIVTRGSVIELIPVKTIKEARGMLPLTQYDSADYRDWQDRD